MDALGDLHRVLVSKKTKFILGPIDCKHIVLVQWKAILDWLLKMVVVGPRQPSRQQKPMHLL